MLDLQPSSSLSISVFVLLGYASQERYPTASDILWRTIPYFIKENRNPLVL
jgi:hypothetical protein